jgi:hypothetical protein
MAIRFIVEPFGGKVRVLASIEDPTIIDQILEHLASRKPPQRPGSWAGRLNVRECLKCLLPSFTCPILSPGRYWSSA